MRPINTGRLGEPGTHKSHPSQPAPLRPGPLMLLADTAVLAIAAAINLTWLRGVADAAWFAAGGALLVAMLALSGEYRGTIPQNAGGAWPRLVVVAAIVSAAAGALRMAVGKGDDMGQEAFRTWVAFTGCIGLARLLFRAAYARAHAAGKWLCPTLIIGIGEVGRTVARRLEADVRAGLAPIGFLDDVPEGDLCEAADRPAPLLGGVEDLEAIVDRHGVRCVVVTFSSAGDDRLVDIVRRCWRLEVPVLVVPRLFEVQSHRTDLHRLGRFPLQPLAPPRSRSWGLRAKYAVDRAMAAVALVALAPLLIAIAASIRLTLGSPVLFRQQRVGRGGRTFAMLKFRTLEASAESLGEADYTWAAATLGTTPITLVAAAAPRCTRLGAFLRRMSLDELPQFINVLKGEMSLIGPRPERLSYVQLFEPAIQGYSDRHRMKVGLTGWAQVHGLRGDTSLLDRVEWDNAYIDAWSPWLDMRILCRTLKAVLRSPADAARRPYANATPGAPPGQLQAGARRFTPVASEPDARRAQPEGVSASTVQRVGVTAGRTEPY